MKKTLSFLLAFLMLLSVAAFASADESETVADTEFPHPDAVLDIKSVSTEVNVLTEEFMKQLVGADIVVSVSYASNASSVQAYEQYKSYIESTFPGSTDSNGNFLSLGENNTSTNYMTINIKLPAEVITIAGEEELGWIDFSSCSDVLKKPRYSPEEKILTISSSNGLCGISMRLLLEYVNTNSSLSDVSSHILRNYTLYNDGTPIPDSENIYHNIETSEFELDGRPAFKLKGEADDGVHEQLLFAVYVTTNAAGDFVRINVNAPKNEGADANGNPDIIGIEDLCAVIENTYTRTQP